MALRMGVVVQAHGDLLVHAHAAALAATVDAGVVEGRVVRAEVASAAVPQRRHCGMGWDDVGSWLYNQDQDGEVNVPRSTVK